MSANPYPLMWSLGNVNHEPCGELPKHYQGDPWGTYKNYEKEEHWYSDSNFFGNPFEEEKENHYDFDFDFDNFDSYGERENNHAVLGLKRSASQEDIKIAFRQKAMETHPDKGGDEEEFKKVRAAYECLIS